MIILFLLPLVCFTVIQSKPMDNGKAETCGYDACPAYDPDALNVHLVPHSHDDVGWLKTADQYYFQDVQNVINSIVLALKQKSDRRFVQVETAFFKKFWEQAEPETRQDTINLINNGQLEIINAGWSMNDEGATHYQSTIDQFTLGLRYIEDNLGKCARPRVGWQIDPFGHSREQASIFAQLGFDSMFFARLDYRDKDLRRREKRADLLWRGSNSLGNSSDIFTSLIHNHYSAPAGFCFDIVCNDAPIIDDEESPDFNYKQRVDDFANYCRTQADAYPTNNILVTMGDDFRYQSALSNYINMDRLIRGFELYGQEYNGKPIRVFYSTPSCYTKAVNEYALTNNYELEIKTDDFMTLADNANSYVVGYFTSRPASKRYERYSNNLLQVTKQLAVAAQLPYNNANVTDLKEILGIMQHHDAITGTEMQHVTDNYHLLMTNAIKKADYVAGSVVSQIVANQDVGFSTCFLTNVSYCPQTKEDSFTVAVYNPLARPVSQPISLPVDSSDWEILDSNGNLVSYQVDPSISDFSYLPEMSPSLLTLVIMAQDIPPLGLSLYQFNRIQTNSERVYESPKSTRIGYETTSFEIDESSGLLQSVTMNGITVDVTQELLYYSSQGGSGAYTFNPSDDELKTIAAGGVKTTVINGDVYQGVVQEFSDWAKQIIKVYQDDQSYIEIDWLVGPIDVSDNFGKEVVSKFTTSLQTNSTFYTDSNGREMIERIRNHRPTFDYTNEEPVSGNYWPVNNKIVMKDESNGIEFAVLTGKSEGGTSLQDGQLELMIHRGCVNRDFGDETLNEQEYGQGIVVRGQHYLVLGPISGNGQKSLAAIERELAIRKHLAPWSFITNQPISISGITASLVNRALPENVHLLTLEQWRDNQILLRLEHTLEKDEDATLSQAVTIDLSDLFTGFQITKLEELTLGANMLLEESNRLHWPGSSNDQIISHGLEDLVDMKITVGPMQIRTLLATISL